MRKTWKRYQQIRREKGWKGLVKEVGWQAALLLFLFFLLKGLVWLAVFYGLFEAVAD